MPIEKVAIDFPRAMLWKVMIGGYMGGIAGDAIAPATVSGAYVFDAQTADYAAAEGEMLEVIDGGLQKVNIAVSGRPTGPFALTDADFDYDMFVMSNSGAIDNSNTPFRRLNRNAELVDLPPMGLAIQQRLYDVVSTTSSQFQWVTEIFPLVTLAPSRAGATQRQHSATTYRVTPYNTKKDLTGESFSSSAKMKTYRERLQSYTITSDSPIHMAVYKTNSALASTFTLPFLPLSTVVTLGSSPNEVWRNGAREAATSVNITTGEIVTAAGSSGDIIVVLYTTNFVPSP